MESTTATKPRPTRNQPEVLNRAAEILYDRMQDYGIELDADEDKGRILKQIGDALRGGSNGYERAREMERYHGWMPDAQFVEWLDDDTRWDALREAQKAWVISNGIVPRLAVGAAVVIANPDKWRKDATAEVSGSIVRVEAEQGEYTVNVPAHGQGPMGGYVLTFEAVETSANLASSGGKDADSSHG
jgi:hypothetical protein